MQAHPVNFHGYRKFGKQAENAYRAGRALRPSLLQAAVAADFFTPVHPADGITGLRAFNEFPDAATRVKYPPP